MLLRLAVSNAQAVNPVWQEVIATAVQLLGLLVVLGVVYGRRWSPDRPVHDRRHRDDRRRTRLSGYRRNGSDAMRFLAVSVAAITVGPFLVSCGIAPAMGFPEAATHR
jgi:hypothetical protein